MRPRRRLPMRVLRCTVEDGAGGTFTTTPSAVKLYGLAFLAELNRSRVPVSAGPRRLLEGGPAVPLDILRDTLHPRLAPDLEVPRP